jgi:hypothetical protein
LPTGTQIRNVADVSFDEQPIIATDQVSETDPTQGTDPAKEALVTIDAGPPTSTVATLPAQETTPSFTVSWSGSDDAGGSGIAAFDVFVQTDGGPFVPFMKATTTTSATFNGAVGHTYGFYSVATDNVGHREATPASAEASTTVVTQTQLIVSSNGDSGAGTLRQALLDANNSSGSPHTIQFQLPAGSQTITPATPLPIAADPLTLSLDATQNVTLNPPAGTVWSDSNSLSISGTGSFTIGGGIEGVGDLSVGAGGRFTASHIIQGALVIGGTAGSPAIVTIAASDSAGNPLVSPSSAPASVAAYAALVANKSVTTRSTGSAEAVAPDARASVISPPFVASTGVSVKGSSDDSVRSVRNISNAGFSSALSPEASAVDAMFGGSSPRLDPQAVMAIMDSNDPFGWSADDKPERAPAGVPGDNMLWDELCAAL